MIAYMMRHQMIEQRIPPIVRHSLHVAYGHMPSAHPVDKTLVALFRYGREEDKIEEIEFLLMLMEVCGRVTPIAYPDEDRMVFIILPNGRKIWEANPPPAEPAASREDASLGDEASSTP